MIAANRNELFNALGVESDAIQTIRGELKAQMVAAQIVGATAEQEVAMIAKIDMTAYKAAHAEVLRIAKATTPEA